MDRKPYYNSGYEKEEHYNYAFDGFNEILDTTALGDEIIVYHNGIIDKDAALHIKAIVQNNSSDVIDNDKVKQILSNIDTFYYGDYVFYKNKYYLITDVPGDNKFYGKAIMQQCNYLLKWIDNLGNIVEQWSIFKNVTKEYATGISETKSLTLGVVTTSLYLPKNNKTVRLKLNDRLIIDDYEHAQIFHPAVYKITKLNLVQKNDFINALFIYTLEDTQFNSESDDKVLMIADYYNRIRTYDIELISPVNIQIQVNQSFDIKAKVTINGEYSNEEIALSSSDESIVRIQDSKAIGVSNGNAIIYLASHTIVKEINVSVVGIVTRYQNTCHIEFDGKQILKGELEKEFKAYFYDSNGNETHDIPVWNILDKDGAAVSWIAVRKTGNSIFLKSQTTDWIIGQKIRLVLNGSGGLSEDIVTLEIGSIT
jgi:hypothetical protein